MEKTKIDVECIYYPDGSFRPKRVIWTDGRCWDVERTLHICEPSGDEFEGIRYCVLIGSAEKYIYRTGASWYAEPVCMEENTS